MTKFPKPWCRKNRGWYVTLDGEQIPLGKDREAAMAAYHKLMQQPREKRKVSSDSVATLIDKFLDYVQKNLAADTYEWYRSRLQCWCEVYPDLTVSELKNHHVQSWIDGIEGKPGTKRNYARSIQRCMSWCDEMDHIDHSPIAKFKKPGGGKRERIVTSEEYRKILLLGGSDEFRDLVTVCWECGCRPQEVLAVEARLLNYTTKVSVDRSVAEIMKMLSKHGAIAIMDEHDQTGTIEAMSFRIPIDGKPIGFKLPVNWRPVLQIINEDRRVPSSKKTNEHARCVAWRILKDWVEAQLAILETRMVTVDQVFLPYAISNDGRTLYEAVKSSNLLLSA